MTKHGSYSSAPTSQNNIETAVRQQPLLHNWNISANHYTSESLGRTLVSEGSIARTTLGRLYDEGDDDDDVEDDTVWKQVGIRDDKKKKNRRRGGLKQEPLTTT